MFIYAPIIFNISLYHIIIWPIIYIIGPLYLYMAQLCLYIYRGPIIPPIIISKRNDRITMLLHD